MIGASKGTKKIGLMCSIPQQTVMAYQFNLTDIGNLTYSKPKIHILSVPTLSDTNN